MLLKNGSAKVAENDFEKDENVPDVALDLTKTRACLVLIR